MQSVSESASHNPLPYLFCVCLFVCVRVCCSLHAFGPKINAMNWIADKSYCHIGSNRSIRNWIACGLNVSWPHAFQPLGVTALKWTHFQCNSQILWISDFDFCHMLYILIAERLKITWQSTHPSFVSYKHKYRTRKRYLSTYKILETN